MWGLVSSSGDSFPCQSFLQMLRLMYAAIHSLSSRFFQTAVFYLLVFLNMTWGRTPSYRELLVVTTFQCLEGGSQEGGVPQKRQEYEYK